MTSIKGSAPDPVVLAHEVGLPAHATFKGWAVNAPDRDEFLALSHHGDDAAMRTWCATPEGAKLFEKADDALHETADLGYAAVVVAVFDISNQIGVIPVGGNEHSEFGQP